jgi:hypothetical protein
VLREELILARSEIVAAMKRAPEELEERSPLARIIYSQCVRHRGHHLEQLHAWIGVLINLRERKGMGRVSTQLDSADAGPRSSNRAPYNSLLDPMAGCFLFISQLLPNMDLSSSTLKRNFVHSQFHQVDAAPVFRT